MILTWASSAAPFFAYAAADKMATFSKGRIVKPIQFLEQPHIITKMTKWTGVSSILFFGTCVAFSFVNKSIKKVS